MVQSQYCKMILLAGLRCYVAVSSDKKLRLKNYEYSCHSERSAASLRISAALKERFFAALRMTSNSLLSAYWYETPPEVQGQPQREALPPPGRYPGPS